MEKEKKIRYTDPTLIDFDFDFDHIVRWGDDKIKHDDNDIIETLSV